MNSSEVKAVFDPLTCVDHVVPPNDTSKQLLTIFSKMLNILCRDAVKKLNCLDFSTQDVLSNSLTFQEVLGDSLIKTRNSSYDYYPPVIEDLMVIKKFIFSVLNSSYIDVLEMFVEEHLQEVANSKILDSPKSKLPSLWPFLEGNSELFKILCDAIEGFLQPSVEISVLELLQDFSNVPGPKVIITRNKYQAHYWNRTISDFNSSFSNSSDFSFLKHRIVKFLEKFNLIPRSLLDVVVRDSYRSILTDSKIKSLVSSYLKFSPEFLTTLSNPFLFSGQSQSEEQSNGPLSCEFVDFDPTIIISAETGTSSFLRSLRPSVVLLIHPYASAVRQVQIYQSFVPNGTSTIKIFKIFHTQLEIDLHNQSQAHEQQLIDHLHSLSLSHTPPVSVSTTSQSKGTVIVDSREFRSSLPLALHEHGIKVVPVTMTAGDYVISKGVGIERKTLSDLIASLNSGHLHKQVRRMRKSFEKSILMVELADPIENVSFLERKIQSSLIALNYSFPDLNITWTFGSYGSAKSLIALQANLTQPSLDSVSHLLENESGIEEVKESAMGAESLVFLVGQEWHQEVCIGAINGGVTL
ncbi:hypothetical protein GEMRC1_005222 [Eukaryota sp. GEM-RC1]